MINQEESEVQPKKIPIAALVGSGGVLLLLAGVVIGYSLRRLAPVQRVVLVKPAPNVLPTVQTPAEPAVKPKEPPKPAGKPVTAKPATSLGPFKPDLKVPSLPAPISGAIAPFHPGITEGQINQDLRGAEAKVRVLADQAGGHVVSASDASGTQGSSGRTVIVSVNSTKSAELSMKIRNALHDQAVVSETDVDVGTVSVDPKAERSLSELRRRVEQAKRDFLPDAPVLKDLEIQLREETQQLADQRRKLGHNVLLSVLLKV